MRLFALVLGAALLACGDDGVSPPAELASTYTLQTVDGEPLPHLVYTSDSREVQTTAGSLSFSGNTATFTQTRRERDVGTSQWQNVGPREFILTFTRTGNVLQIGSASEPVPSAGLAASVSGDGATVSLSFPLETIPYTGNRVSIFRRN